MRHSISVRFCCAALLLMVLLFNGCGKKPRVYVAIIDSDTLSFAACKALMPDTALSAGAVIPLLREMLLARLDTGATDSLVMADLADQLSLQSGQQWSKNSAQLLYKAARALRGRLLLAGSGSSFVQEFDSLMNKRVVLAQQFTPAPLSAGPDSVWKAAVLNERVLKSIFPACCVSLFAIKPAVADWIVSFLFSEEKSAAVAQRNIKQMISGLIFDSAAAKKALPAVPKVEVLNNREIIKVRSRQSIADSISQRSAELEGIYKMHLKLAPQLAGTVLVFFRVRPDGSVVSADLRSKQIRDRKFLEALQTYIVTMHFKPVTPALGDMTFEFPFNFSPEQ